MAVRLIELRRVLKPTGSIYLHVDPTASHYLKVVMDCIFGKQNFRNEIVWCYSKWTNTAKYFQRNSDIILFYSASPDYTFNKLYGELTKSMKAIRSRGYNGGSSKGVPILRIYDRHNPKAISQINSGKYATENIYYIDKPAAGAPLNNWWSDIPIAAGNERCGYPTQKPIALLKRIILASSNESDLVLDPFCGCATACVAAQDTGRKWVGIDISLKAVELINRRFKKELGLISPEIIHRTDIPHREGKLSKDIKHILYGLQEGLCTGCEHYFHFRNMTKDHIVPTSKGGPDSDDNLQLLCGACNSLKGNRKTMPELKAELHKQGILRAA